MTSPRLESQLSANSSSVISIFRIIVGLLFALHGAVGVFAWPLGEAATPVGEWPGWWSAIIELVAGLLVAVGLFTRPAAFIASGEMAVAYFWMHWPPLEGPAQSFWPLSRDLGGNGGELAIMYCFAFLLLVFIGPGRWAIESRRSAAASTTTAPAARRPGLLSRLRRR